MTTSALESRAPNPRHRFAYPDFTGLWWREDAWNEDTLEWLTDTEDNETLLERADGVELKLAGIYGSALLPEMAMTGDQAATWYLNLKEPQLQPSGSKAEDIYQRSAFKYNPSDSMSLAIQLVRHYTQQEAWAVADWTLPWDAGVILHERVATILGFTHLTVEEWDWLQENLEFSENLNADGNVFDWFATSPGLHLLPSRPALAGKSPVDYLATLLSEKLAELLRRFKEDPDEMLSTNRIDNAFENTKMWLLGKNPQSGHLDVLFEDLEALAGAFSNFISPGKVPSRLTSSSIIAKLLGVMQLLRLHPNFTGPQRSQGRTLLLACADRKKLRAIEDDAVIPYLTLTGGVVVDENGDPATEAVTSKWVLDGQLPDMGFPTVNDEHAHVVCALTQYTREQARPLFEKFVLNSEETNEWYLPVVLAPMFGAFFKELRGQFGDPDRNIPLKWILETYSEVGCAKLVS